MKSNIDLFWYGFKARAFKFLGILGALTSIVVIAFSFFFGIVLLIGSIIILAKGSSREYDYKRQGGHILYRD